MPRTSSNVMLSPFPLSFLSFFMVLAKYRGIFTFSSMFLFVFCNLVGLLGGQEDYKREWLRNEEVVGTV